MSENESHGHNGHVNMTVLKALKQKWEELISHKRLKGILRHLNIISDALVGKIIPESIE